MIFGLLLSILSATYTVVSSTSVSVSGEVPEGSAAVYSRSGTTGQKGQMTAGHSTTLQLIGWDACMIDSVALNMRSNASAGAGSLRMRIGGRMVWNVADNSFDAEVWHGRFSTQWVDIVGDIGKRVGAKETIEIDIKASENSLYINSYTIYYSVPSPEAYEVRLVSGLGTGSQVMQEEQVGGGVLLPMLSDTLDWRFVGWSEVEVMEDSVCPIVRKPGERFYPKYDCKLWAVYSDGIGSVTANACASGDYVMASAAWAVALTGGVVGKQVATVPVLIDTTASGEYMLLSGAQDEMIYSFDFKEDSTVVIWNETTLSAVGYSGADIADNDVLWRYRVLGDGSYCFYYDDNTRQRMLCVGYGKDGNSEQIVAYVIRSNISAIKDNGFWLFNTEENTYTTWPFGKLDGVEDVFVPNNRVGDYRMCFGPAVLEIKQGQKRLIVRP